jgi:N-acetylglucosamine-6-phosphate deacetylase
VQLTIPLGRHNSWSCEPLINNVSRCLGIEDMKGTLREGADADLVVVDHKGNVLSTWVKGKIVWGGV